MFKKKGEHASAIGIIEAVCDKRLIGDTLSPAQATALKALYGEPLSAAEMNLYALATGRDKYSTREYREAMFICGRRSGKSSKLAGNIAVFESCFREYALASGERGYVLCLAGTRKQAQVVFRYILARLNGSPTLRRMIEGEPRMDEVDLSNGITIAVQVASFRTIRGSSVVCVICDELAFWLDVETGANPASQVLQAVRPAMATFPNAKLIKISSPYAKQGVVWEDYRSRNERDDILVWKMDSATMNPSLDQAFLAAEAARDSEFAAREYGACFWESASSYLPVEMVEAAVVPLRYELMPQPEAFYSAALDCAFRGDNFAFSVVHRTPEGRIIQDLNRCWRGSKSKPVNLASTLEEIVSVLRRYDIASIAGDQHAAEPIKQALATEGIQFFQRTTLGNRAQCFSTLRTLITSNIIELLDDAAQTAELKSLQQIVTGSGSVRVEASGSGHDDRCVALALAAHESVTDNSATPWVEIVSTHDTKNLTPSDDGPERWWRRVQ